LFPETILSGDSERNRVEKQKTWWGREHLKVKKTVGVGSIFLKTELRS
jgi:hypothetical protein